LNGEWHNSRKPLTLSPGDELLLRTPAGGGFGPPEERDPALIERDKREDYSE
jgi:N-methylhydantoinase B